MVSKASKLVTAGLLCATAFNAVAPTDSLADEKNQPFKLTPQVVNTHCLTPDQLGTPSDRLQNTNRQNFLLESLNQIRTSSSGKIIVEANIENDVVICSIPPEMDSDNGNGGYYNWPQNLIVIKDDEIFRYKPENYYAAIAEELSHAYQFHTNPLAHYRYNTDLQLFDQYAMRLGLEAQAKIWGAQILHDLGVDKITARVDKIVYQAALDCFNENSVGINSCLTKAFSEIFVKDNGYTNSTIGNLTDTAGSYRDTKTIRPGTMVPNYLYKELFGQYFVNGEPSNFFEKNFKYDSISFSQEDSTMSQSYAFTLKTVDGDYSDSPLPRYSQLKIMN